MSLGHRLARIQAAMHPVTPVYVFWTAPIGMSALRGKRTLSLLIYTRSGRSPPLRGTRAQVQESLPNRPSSTGGRNTGGTDQWVLSSGSLLAAFAVGLLA